MQFCAIQTLSLRDVQMLQQMPIHFCFYFKNALAHHRIKQFL